eukprot:1895296-Lingulodinium_polyedra.AAC.1
MLKDDAAPLRQVLGATPPGALLLIVGGSPCQDLTIAGPSRGRLGLAGAHSVQYYAIPAIASAAAALRPDVEVHAMCENAGTTKGEFR